MIKQLEYRVIREVLLCDLEEEVNTLLKQDKGYMTQGPLVRGTTQWVQVVVRVEHVNPYKGAEKFKDVKFGNNRPCPVSPPCPEGTCKHHESGDKDANL